jgi:RimJ/RimL family protein N-acetyltransferase
MGEVEYVRFSDIDAEEFISILNEEEIRNHLISHQLFDPHSVNEWVKEKIACGNFPGCRIRAVYLDGSLIGWCGIQKDDDNYELAIVISKSSWGIGISIFREMIVWAKELGHKEVLIHLLETRPEYKFLERKSINSHTTEMLGRKFRTYHIAV